MTPPKGWQPSPETRAKWSASKIGNQNKAGKKDKPETIERKRLAHLGKLTGENSYFWQGGREEQYLARREELRRPLYKWAVQVKERDGACIKCGTTYKLEAHHIKSIIEFPELALEISNGITLCRGCHWKEHHAT